MDHSDLMQPPVLDRIEHGHDAGRVDLHTDHVDIGLGRGHLDRRLTVAEPDVEDDVAVPAEHVGPVEDGSLDRRYPTCRSTCRTRPGVSATANAAAP